MSAYSLIAIILATLAVIAAVLGYALGLLRTERERSVELERQVKVNEAYIRAHGAVIARIAEDYDRPDPTPEERRRAFTIVKGGGAGALLPLAGLGLLLRRHPRSVVATVGATGAAAVIAGALLAHGSPPPASGPPASPPRSARTTATTSPAPSVSPSRARPAPTKPPGRVPPVVPLPVRSRRGTPTASSATASPSGPPTPSPSVPMPSPTRSCVLVYLDALHIISVCI